MRTAKMIVSLCFFGTSVVFSQISSTPRAQTWVTNGAVYSIAATGNKVYIGGNFTRIGPLAKPDSIVRNHLACIDTATGAATDWDPNVNGYVNVISVIGSKVYVGGYFDTIAGQRMKNIACLDTGTGQPTSWDPNSKSSLNALFIDGAKVYVGTNYDGLGCDSIGGKKRRYAACVDTGTGLANNWNPGTNLPVYALVASGADVYVGGIFTGIGVTTMHYLSCVDSGTGALKTSFNPRAPDGYITTLVLTGTTLYVGGAFTSMGGQTRHYIACLDTADGLATNWDPNANNYVFTMSVNETDVYVGGIFTTIGGQARNFIASLDTGTGLATNWNPNANNPIQAISANATNAYIGGAFTTIGGVSRPYFAQFGEDVTPVITTHPEVTSVSFYLSTSNFTGDRGTIRYSLPYDARVSLCIYDMKGRLFLSIVNQFQTAGNYTIPVSSERLGTGLYLLRFSAGGYEKTMGLTIMR